MPLSADQRLEISYAALKHYDLKPSLVTFLQHSENVTFRVDCPESAFLLRLHTPRAVSFGQHGADPQVVNSEMLWLASLRQAELPVPAPIKNKAGGYVSQTAGLNATLLAWQPGDLLTAEMESEETAAQIGSLVGQIHAQVSRWTYPDAFSRPHRDATYFQDALQALRPAIQDGRISYFDYETLKTSLTLLEEEIDRLPPGNQTWGLLHGDLHRGNFLLHEGQIRLIDFSMCAFGHFAYDLATCLSNVRAALHPVFLERYTQHFALPPGYERLLEGYFLASYIATFSLWISDVKSQEALIQRIAYIAREYATRFNRDERFWFEKNL